jgi:hypothetical protein
MKNQNNPHQQYLHMKNYNLTKKNNHFFLLIIIIVALSTSMIGCLNEDICEDVATLPVRIGFYMVDTAATTSPKMAIDSITVFGLGNDSIIYNNQKNVAQIEVPLNSNIDSCAFVIRFPGLDDFDTDPYDTLWFIYERQPNLISMDCGFVTFYQIERINFTGNRIDSIHIEDSNIRNELNEHIKLFPIIPDVVPIADK